MRNRIKISAIDLFCGAGGLTYGFRKAGIPVRAGVDFDGDCAYPFKKNNKTKFLHADIKEVPATKLARLYPKNDIKVLAGCAPCQPFSSYTQGDRGSKDDKWSLLNEFGRMVRNIKPAIVTMENVPNLRKHKVYKKFIDDLKSQGYSVTEFLVYCPKYMIPQQRKRLVVFASKWGEIELLKPQLAPPYYRTVKQAIGNLPRVAAGKSDRKDRLHRASSMSKTNMERIRQSKPGGTWEDWDPELRADCHRQESGKSYSAVYGRMEWNRPSPTITTLCFGFGNGRFGHPTQNRALTLREAAILQTFPRKYAFVKPGEDVRFKSVGRMIGNAVPVKLGELIARSILRHVREKHHRAAS